MFLPLGARCTRLFDFYLRPICAFGKGCEPFVDCSVRLGKAAALGFLLGLGSHSGGLK